ncbi:Dabb family protein [Uliginosibacterium sp. H3]|uniref:Dabb family protein n=1 Tax=Uliginosibacterium silvisoli TaxID=3114758 RepID=A0ABU6K9U4_9RHOO|nr:Dabb family protein [Uliginosibacterium sp. H3]
MITHVVLFKWRDGVTAQSEAAQALHAAFQLLPGQIEEICDWQCGFNTTADDKAWDYLLVSTFQSREDLHTYFEHPAHARVVEMADRITELGFGDLE